MPYEETYPADEQMHAEGAAPAPGGEQGLEQTAQVLEQLPPEIGYVIVDIALNMPEFFQNLVAVPPEQLQELLSIYEQHFQQAQQGQPAAEPMPEDQAMAGGAYM